MMDKFCSNTYDDANITTIPLENYFKFGFVSLPSDLKIWARFVGFKESFLTCLHCYSVSSSCRLSDTHSPTTVNEFYNIFNLLSEILICPENVTQCQ